MLKKAHRLSRDEFTHLLSHGTRISGTGFSLLYTTRNKETKYAVVVGKKTASRAVERNRLRRKVYTLCTIERFTSKKPHIAIFVTKHANEMTYAEIQKTLDALFERVR